METKEKAAGWNIGKKIGSSGEESRLLSSRVLMTLSILCLFGVVMLTQIGCAPSVAKAIINRLDEGQVGVEIVPDETSQKINSISRAVERILIAPPEDNLGNGTFVSSLLRDKLEGIGIPLHVAFNTQGIVVVAANQPTYHTLSWASGQLSQRAKKRNESVITTAYFQVTISDGPTIAWRQRYSLKTKNALMEDVYRVAIDRAVSDFFTDCAGKCRQVVQRKVAILQ